MDFLQASLDWEPVTDPANRTRSHRKTSTAHSETEADSLRYDVNRSRSSTMTSQQHLVDNDNGEVSLIFFMSLVSVSNQYSM